MNRHNPDMTDDIDLKVVEEPEFRRILGDLLEAMEQGDTAAFDRYARQHPAYAPALLQAALCALPASERMREEADLEPDTAVAAGIQAAMKELGIAPGRTILAMRSDLGLSLGELARRLLIPARAALKLERGQIARWPERLATKLAEALQTTWAEAEAILQTTSGNFSMEAAAYSADGDPDVAVAAKNRQVTFDFEEALAMEQLTPEQAEFWKAGD
jgi:hypothetical protein